MAGYLILGAGKFGRLALTRLGRRETGEFWVVDTEAAALAMAQDQDLIPRETHWVQEEAIGFLARHLTGDSPWDWIIPMVPVHVAAAWLLAGPLSGGKWQVVPVPEEFWPRVPVLAMGAAGEIYLSRARHRCPDDCDEPANCPVSGESREPPLYQELVNCSSDAHPMLVIPATQLAPGVGGYPPGLLRRLAREVAAAPGEVLVATACNCHGVVHGLARRPGGSHV